jgi:hypothetical protein
MLKKLIERISRKNPWIIGMKTRTDKERAQILEDEKTAKCTYTLCFS